MVSPPLAPHPQLMPSPPPLGRSESPGPDQEGASLCDSPPTMDRAWLQTHMTNSQSVFFPLLQASLKPERREQGVGTESQKEGSPDQVACFHLQRTGVVLPRLLVGDRELRKTRMETNSRKGGRGWVPSPGGSLRAGPRPGREAGGGACRKEAEGWGEGRVWGGCTAGKGARF